jgi:hypothetical protein
MDMVGLLEIESQFRASQKPLKVKEMVMAKVIGFYVPKNFRNRLNWAPQLHGGKVIEFRPQSKKSA